MAESSDTSSSEQCLKRRKLRPETWKSVVNKKARVAGKEYEDYKGRKHPARSTGSDCRCKRSRTTKFSNGAKKQILKEFYNIGSKDGQDAFLAALISPKNVQRRTPRSDDPRFIRTHSFTYKIQIGVESHVVCAKAFRSLFGISETRVRRVANYAALGKSPRDQRGRNPASSRALKNTLVETIDEHIRLFPYRTSQYGASGKKKRYLETGLSVMKMYELFLEKYYPECYLKVKAGADIERVKCPIKYDYYRKYFNENFGYSFGRPKVDACNICEKLQMEISQEKNKIVKVNLETELTFHKRKAKKFYTNLRACQERAQEDDTVECLIFDFQQNMPVTHLPWEESKGKMYMWAEYDAKRGVNEVVSCLRNYIENYVPDTVKTLYLFSDACPGQNLNNTMVQFCYTLIQSDRFNDVQHYLPIRGHSYLPCDRCFSVIERMKKKVERIEMPQGWYDMVSRKYDVVVMKGEDFREHKEFLKGYFKKSVTKSGRKFTVSKYKVLTYSSAHKFQVKTSENMSGELCEYFRICKPRTGVISLPNTPLYTNRQRVKSCKLDDIKKLCKYLSKDAQNLYNSLPSQEDEDDYSDGSNA
ncbi:hypothetical protein ANN_24672 [Periplaneta americana]|uniref:DUF7869 domain-containing protein n=1 Tax=Periplaneta americana TaxID=6978 RepID=A0ABQ8S418_PERAM|nr:hypothetical protein ANN_24672 [Periplaneta americana]